MSHFNAARALMKSFSLGEETTEPSLKQRLEQQNLIIQTLLVILLDKGVITEEEFNDWVVKMDRLDGVRDGRLKVDKSTVACSECGAENLRVAAECSDCGHKLEPDLLPRRPK